MRRKVIPIGEVRYESEGGLVEVDGVIEETSNGQFVDPQKRTYFGGRINEDGLTESSGFYLRDRTDKEKRADLERILFQEPTWNSIIKNTKMQELPRALTTHAYNLLGDFIYDINRSVHRFVRKNRLQWQLNRQNIQYKGKDFDFDAFEFGYEALSYVWLITSRVAEEQGVNSELFQEVAEELLTKRERKKIIENVMRGEDANWGIATVEDRRYDHKKVIGLYKKAREFSQKYGLESSESDFYYSYQQHLKSKVESSPFFKLK